MGKEADLWSPLFRGDLGQDLEEGSAGNRETTTDLGKTPNLKPAGIPAHTQEKYQICSVLSLLFLVAFAYSHSWKQDHGLDQPLL